MTDKQAGQELLNMMTKTGEKSMDKKEVAKSAVGLLSKYVPAMEGSLQRISDREAAKAFVPTLRGSMVQFGVPLVVGTAAGGATGSFDVAAASALATGAVTSPRLAKNVLQGMTKSRQWLLTRPLEELAAFRKSPEAMKMFFQSITDIPAVKEQTQNMLMQQVQGGGQSGQ